MSPLFPGQPFVPPGRPYVVLNCAISADGRIAAESGDYEPFGSETDAASMYALRATVDAVMCGARTLMSYPTTLGVGNDRHRRARLRRGLAEYPLRVAVSGTASLTPDAAIFQHRFSPVIVLTAASAPVRRRRALEATGATVQVSDGSEVDFPGVLAWLHREHGVRRLLSEGGGRLNGALFRAGLVDEVHVTVCPCIFGGRRAPTLADGDLADRLADAVPLALHSRRRVGDEIFLVYRTVR